MINSPGKEWNTKDIALGKEWNNPSVAMAQLTMAKPVKLSWK